VLIIILSLISFYTYPCVSHLRPKAEVERNTLIPNIDKIIKRKSVRTQNGFNLFPLSAKEVKASPLGTVFYTQKGKRILKTKETNLNQFLGVRKGDFEIQLNLQAFSDETYFKKNKMDSMKTFEYLKLVRDLKNKTFIWLDIETTGLDPFERQVTEIFARKTKVKISSDGHIELKDLDSFHHKAKLSKHTLNLKEKLDQDPESVSGWTIDKILRMQNYGKTPSDDFKYLYEADLLNSFKHFVSDSEDNVIVIQNAEFDYNFLNLRSASTGVEPIFNKGFVLDTKHALKMFWIPLMISLEKKGNIRARGILNKLVKISSDGSRFYSSSMGRVTKALEIENSSWHMASADVEMMIQMFKDVFLDLNFFKKENSDLNSFRKFIVDR